MHSTSTPVYYRLKLQLVKLRGSRVAKYPTTPTCFVLCTIWCYLEYKMHTSYTSDYTVLLLLLFDEIRRETRKLEQLWKFFYVDFLIHARLRYVRQNCVKNKNKNRTTVLFCFLFRFGPIAIWPYDSMMAAHTQTGLVFPPKYSHTHTNVHTAARVPTL